TDLAGTGIPCVADQAGDFRLGLGLDAGIGRADRCRRLEPLEVKRLVRAQVDDAADTALDLRGGRGLVHVRASKQARGNVLEIQGATARGGKYGIPVQLRLDLGQAADGDGRAFTLVLDRLHTGDALQSVGGIRVGQLADVLGNDRLHDLRRVTLAVLR